MKIDNITKERVFALYWNCLIDTSINGTPITSRWMAALEKDELDASIIVTPLSQITDEDARVIHQGHNASDFIRYFNGDMDLAMKSLNTIGFDYLRSRGYALPYMNYSVDDLVSAGVFKLRAG